MVSLNALCHYSTSDVSQDVLLSSSRNLPAARAPPALLYGSYHCRSAPIDEQRRIAYDIVPLYKKLRKTLLVLGEQKIWLETPAVQPAWCNRALPLTVPLPQQGCWGNLAHIRFMTFASHSLLDRHAMHVC